MPWPDGVDTWPQEAWLSCMRKTGNGPRRRRGGFDSRPCSEMYLPRYLAGQAVQRLHRVIRAVILTPSSRDAHTPEPSFTWSMAEQGKQVGDLHHLRCSKVRDLLQCCTDCIREIEHPAIGAPQLQAPAHAAFVCGINRSVQAMRATLRLLRRPSSPSASWQVSIHARASMDVLF